MLYDILFRVLDDARANADPEPANALTTLSCAYLTSSATGTTSATSLVTCPKLPIPLPAKSTVEIVLTSQATASPGTASSVTFSMPLSKDDKDTWIGFATGATGAFGAGAVGAGQSADWLAVEIKGKKMKYTRKGSAQVEVEVTGDGDKKYKFTGGTVTYKDEDPFTGGPNGLVIGLAIGGGILLFGIIIAIYFLARKRAARLSDSIYNSSTSSSGFESTTY